MKRKTLYESPLVQDIILDLEQALCASVVMDSSELGIFVLDEIDKSGDWI